MAPSPAHVSRAAGKRRILIVDDEEGMRELLKAILESDYQVAEADSGAALQKALYGEQPDVVLLDMKLPDAEFGRGLVGFGWFAGAVRAWNNFSRLWVRQMICRSAAAFSRPRIKKPRNPRRSLICPNTGSTTALRIL